MLKTFCVVVLGMMVTRVALAQKKIDFDNIFNTRNSYVGVPTADRVFIYAYSEGRWDAVDTLKIPENCRAIDGNIRRVLFLTDDKMMIAQNDDCDTFCEKDTLKFGGKFEKISPGNWLRNGFSTEADYGYLKNEKNVAVYKNGDKWSVSDQLNPNLFKENKTNPVLTSSMPHHKIYLYDQDSYLMSVDKRKARFYRYELTLAKANEQALRPEQLNLDLPKDVLTVFVYDNTRLGWVYKNMIDFYEFDETLAQWQKCANLKPLDFLRKLFPIMR